jgi:hypothetical protein
VSGWAQHIDDLASSAAALLVEGPARPQPLVDARAALAARDAVLLELRALVGAVSDVPQIGEVRELTVFDIVHRSGQALHQALSELPRAESCRPTSSSGDVRHTRRSDWRGTWTL